MAFFLIANLTEVKEASKKRATIARQCANFTTAALRCAATKFLSGEPQGFYLYCVKVNAMISASSLLGVHSWPSMFSQNSIDTWRI